MAAFILHAGPAAAPCHPRNFLRCPHISTETVNNQEKNLLLFTADLRSYYVTADHVKFAYLLSAHKYQALGQPLETQWAPMARWLTSDLLAVDCMKYRYFETQTSPPLTAELVRPFV